MWVIFNSILIAQTEIELIEDLSQGIRWMGWFDIEVLQSTPQM